MQLRVDFQHFVERCLGQRKQVGELDRSDRGEDGRMRRKEKGDAEDDEHEGGEEEEKREKESYRTEVERLVGLFERMAYSPVEQASKQIRSPGVQNSTSKQAQSNEGKWLRQLRRDK